MQQAEGWGDLCSAPTLLGGERPCPPSAPGNPVPNTTHLAHFHLSASPGAFPVLQSQRQPLPPRLPQAPRLAGGLESAAQGAAT